MKKQILQNSSLPLKVEPLNFIYFPTSFKLNGWFKINFPAF